MAEDPTNLSLRPSSEFSSEFSSELGQVVSLQAAFEGEQEALLLLFSGSDDAVAPSPSQAVTALRAALERTAVRFRKQTDDPQLQRTGVWLLELIKSGAALLDRGTQAEVAWVETAPSSGIFSGEGFSGFKPSVFFIAAAILGLVGWVQGTGLVVLSAALLSGLHFVQTRKAGAHGLWGRVRALISGKPNPPSLTDETGRRLSAQARLNLDGVGLVDQLTQSLKTADHILERLAQPASTAHWSDTPRLAGLLQNLLEAGEAEDTDFAMALIAKELPGLLEAGGVDIVAYSKSTRDLFDELPALGLSNKTAPKYEMSAPALRRADGSILRRGTVWVRK